MHHEFKCTEKKPTVLAIFSTVMKTNLSKMVLLKPYPLHVKGCNSYNANRML